MRNCENCKFFDAKNRLCMYKSRFKVIVDVNAEGEYCEYFEAGVYDEFELERTKYQ